MLGRADLHDGQPRHGVLCSAAAFRALVRLVPSARPRVHQGRMTSFMGWRCRAAIAEQRRVEARMRETALVFRGVKVREKSSLVFARARVAARRMSELSY